MAELFGVLRSTPLSESDRRGFRQLRLEFGLRADQRYDERRGITFAIGLIRRFDLDPGTLDGDAQWALGLLGTPSIAPPLRRELSTGSPIRTAGIANAIRDAEWPFALVAVGARERCIASDPFGLHPLYVADVSGGLAFASKPGPLLRSGLVDWDLDPQAVADLCTFDHVMGHATLARQVSVLEPGKMLRANPPCAPQPYDWARHSYFRDPRQPLHHRMAEGLRRGVARATRGASAVVVPLSGGLDSRALVATAKQYVSDIRAITFGSPEGDEVGSAKRVAARLGVCHEVVSVDAAEFPHWLDHGLEVSGGMVSGAHFQILALVHALRPGKDVILDGLGGDALTGGHLPPKLLASPSSRSTASLIARWRATGCRTHSTFAELFEPDFLRANDYDPERRVFDGLALNACGSRWRTMWHFDLVQRQRRFIQYGPHMLRTITRVATPFYTPEFVSAMETAGLRDLVLQRAYRRMHRTQFRSASTVREAGGSLPAGAGAFRQVAWGLGRVVARRWAAKRPRGNGMEQGGPNYAAWFRGSLREFVSDTLLSHDRATRGILRRELLERIVDEHLRSDREHTALLASCLTLERWLRVMRRPLRMGDRIG